MTEHLPAADGLDVARAEIRAPVHSPGDPVEANASSISTTNCAGQPSGSSTYAQRETTRHGSDTRTGPATLDCDARH
ncbi:hypothetical protein LFM09_35545 [Lentzea alba]|uniref:hypothetical protein n=1 Tax=Lentzea alba TaxID=2714351 RepID=UPI0039BF4E2C